MLMIEAVYCWQMVLAILIAIIGTEISKLAIDYVLAVQKDSWREALRSGADARRIRPGIAAGILPLLPIACAIAWTLGSGCVPGVMQAPFIPVEGFRRTLALAAWGTIAGVLASFLFAYAQGLRHSFRDNRAG